MQIKNFVNYHLGTVGRYETLQSAAAKMRHLNVGSIPVCDGNRLVGMVTDRDITIRATADGEDPTVTKVEAVMTPDVICCLENQTVEEPTELKVVTRITGLFDDFEQAKEAVLELKDAGFADERIIVAMNDSDTQVGFLADTRVHVAASEEILNLPELDAGQVLIMVDAPDLAAMALEVAIFNRNHGVTSGIRVPG